MAECSAVFWGSGLCYYQPQTRSNRQLLVGFRAECPPCRGLGSNFFNQARTCWISKFGRHSIARFPLEKL